MFSRRFQYATTALTRLAEQYVTTMPYLSAEEIARERNLRKPYLSKILSELVHAGFIVAQRGPGGGFALACDPDAITLRDIWEVCDHADLSATCPFTGRHCGATDPCAAHEHMANLQDLIQQMLSDTTLAQLATD